MEIGTLLGRLFLKAQSWIGSFPRRAPGDLRKWFGTRNEQLSCTATNINRISLSRSGCCNERSSRSYPDQPEGHHPFFQIRHEHLPAQEGDPVRIHGSLWTREQQCF